MNKTAQATIKTISIGTTWVGKTTLLIQLRTGKYNPNSDATLGCYCFQKIMEKDGRSVMLNMWDTAGQERFNSITQLYYKGTTIAICVFDITKLSTLEALEGYMDKITMERTGRYEPYKILVGNKVDLEESREVTREKAEEIREKYGCTAYIETSSKLGTGIDELSEEIMRCALERLRRSEEDGQEDTNDEDVLGAEGPASGAKKCC